MGFPIRWYGLCFAFAFLAGFQVVSYMFKKEGRPVEQADQLLLYTRKNKGQSYLYVTDRIVIATALAGFFIRFGNLMNSEIIGKPTDLPWGFKFMRDYEFNPSGLAAFVVPRHPSQLYEALSCLVIFAFLLWLWNRQKQDTPHGILTGLFMIILFTLRFFYEFLKENQSSFENGLTLNMGQILSIPAVLFGIGVLWYAKRKA